jgi:regulatory protein
VKQPRSLKARALQLLAQREQSRTELRRKLLRHARAELAEEAASGDPDAAEAGAMTEQRVDALLDWLEGAKYLSPERFIESRVHARAARYGNLRIRQELQQHGLALDPAAAAALTRTELERAREVHGRRFSGVPGDAAERARRLRFLTARGFSPETVRRVLREAGEVAAESDPADSPEAPSTARRSTSP